MKFFDNGCKNRYYFNLGLQNDVFKDQIKKIDF